MIELGGLQRPKRLVVIAVDSAASRGEEWNRREAVPGMLTAMLALGDRSGERANYQVMQTFRAALESWKQAERASSTVPGDSPDYYFIHVGFDAIANAADRSFFLNLMTTFYLPDSTVDRLVAAGGEILRESPEIKRLLNGLRVERPADPVSAAEPAR